MDDEIVLETPPPLKRLRDEENPPETHRKRRKPLDYEIMIDALQRSNEQIKEIVPLLLPVCKDRTVDLAFHRRGHDIGQDAILEVLETARMVREVVAASIRQDTR